MSPDTARPGPRPEPRPETPTGRMAAHEVRQRLEHERDTRLTQLRAVAEAGWAADDHVMVVQKEAIQRVLGEIEAAFARLQDGSYGVCPDCAGPIPAERLEILPYARCCVACGRRAA
ncbi:TraR/DksA C4-type zinc finger protein [Actinacidiphila glaucinigra]|uniref:Transcriptional regulator, TraR/DksA family n=1 Tax=Actinacidiphila glaucinigra TaxID=235986 RepID=A0A239DZT3_9ACTN|nr:transcriptional regulator, TraR/DksA family [Actinacidiphila glaucinigra]